MLLLGFAAGAATKWTALVTIHNYTTGQGKTYQIDQPTCLLPTNEKSCGGFYSSAKTIRIQGKVMEMVIDRDSLMVVTEQ
jgi:hypothetical protein